MPELILEVHPRRHSPLGGSQIDRVLECPASLALGRKVSPKTATFPMLEGTAAHRLAEYLLDPKGGILMPTAIKIFNETDPRLDGVMVQVTREMIDAVTVYLEEVKMALQASGPDAQLFIETEIQCPGIHPEAFGSLDCYILVPSKKLIRIYDYKHGRGKKSHAKLQMGYYGIGLKRKHPEVERYICTTVQPRFFGDDDTEFRGRIVDEWTKTELEDLEGIMHSRAKLAMDILASGAKGEFCAGDHCEWCPGAAICPLKLQKHEKEMDLVLAEAPAEPTLMPVDAVPIETLAKIVLAAPAIEQWLKAVKTHMLALQANGSGSSQLKLVRGKPGNREWKDPEAAAAGLENILGDAAYVHELVSPAVAEKLLGGKAKVGKSLDHLVTRKEGKITLARIDDKRPAVQAAVDALDDIVDEE